jgi:hypothetical protein
MTHDDMPGDMPDSSWWGGDPQGADALMPHESTCEDHDPEQYDDPLSAARGIFNGCILGLAMWAVIAFTIWALRRWL